ncbi:hypothetical protein F511_24456 [Dorcoceras hygrometricum]|uniref:Uncharacterized protein n=1 Tax=Dorcoceras hygrometricum TaxID=472368 RepID=A0A2Z7B3X6_9LAMI|nr:hypothetical protein F511_24456 [Dorcoceras hygrometricum]
MKSGKQVPLVGTRSPVKRSWSRIISANHDPQKEKSAVATIPETSPNGGRTAAVVANKSRAAQGRARHRIAAHVRGRSSRLWRNKLRHGLLAIGRPVYNNCTASAQLQVTPSRGVNDRYARQARTSCARICAQRRAAVDRQSGPRPESIFLRQSALEDLTDFARTETPLHDGRNKSGEGRRVVAERDTASRGPTTIVAPKSQFRTCPTDHDKAPNNIAP